MDIMRVYEAVDGLVNYGIEKSLCMESDRIYVTNLIYGELKLDGNREQDGEAVPDHGREAGLEYLLSVILNHAVGQGIIEDDIVSRDLFDTKIMNLLLPRPSDIIKKFNELYERSPKEATDFYYDFSISSDYIREYRIKKDVKWTVCTEYGNLDVTINLSKPEKDPKAIAMAKSVKQSGYPKCLLCMENVGFAGNPGHPARQNHRIIPVKINNSDWYMQYSPYVYYNEHCIVFNKNHVPMRIDHDTFGKLLDFVEKFPHYFVGSNADLPIVGGSILTHDHFQGGCYEFPMAKAPIKRAMVFAGYEDIESGIVDWPMSVIRIRGSKERIKSLASHILDKWREYTDESSFIYAYTDDTPHNTITPIARMRDGKYEMDLVLRNNITTDEHPFGVYHPHEQLHHIKKENIGLIEVMGLAVLPSRLKSELELLARCYMNDGGLNGPDCEKYPELQKHEEWYVEILRSGKAGAKNIEEVLKEETGKVFLQVLKDAGVYKNEEDFMRFINYIGSTD